MGMHEGNQGGRPSLGDEVMTEKFWIRATAKLVQAIDLRRNARGTPPDRPDRAAMIRYLIELGIEADIRNHKVAD